MRGVDARPLRVRGFGRYVRSRVLRPAWRRRARRGCDATRVIAKERGRRRRADGVERPARGVRQRRIRGPSIAGRRRRGRSTSRLAATFHGASVVKLMFLPRDDSRDVPCVLVAVQENGAVAVWCRPPRRGDDDDVGGRRWPAERAGDRPGSRRRCGVPQGRARGGHRRGARGDGGGGSAGGALGRVRAVVTPSSPPRDWTRRRRRRRWTRRRASRSSRGRSHAVGISRRDGSIAVFLRQDARRGGGVDVRKTDRDATIAAEYPGAIALLGAGGSDLWAVCARRGGGGGGGGGEGRGGGGGGEGGGGTHGHGGRRRRRSRNPPRERVRAYRWNANPASRRRG